MRRKLATFGLVALMLLACREFQASGAELPRDFSEKYGPAASKLQQLYTHATVTGTVRREYPTTGKWIEQRFVFKAAGRRFRLDCTTRSEDDRSRDDVGSTVVYLATPPVSFRAIGGPESPSLDTATELSYEESRARIEQLFPFNRPYDFESSGTLLELLRRSQVNILAIQKAMQNGQSLVKVRFEEVGTPPIGVRNGPVEERSYVLLSPAEGWAMRGYLKTTGRGADETRYRGTVSYNGSRNGVPVVDRIESWQEKGPKRTCVLHEIVQVSSFVTGDPPDVVFTGDGFP